MTDKEQEQYLYKIAKRVLNWADCKDYEEQELWDLIMLELVNVKERVA